MSQELDDLTAEVAAEGTVVQSAIVLINGLAQQIADAGTSQLALTALTGQLKAQAAALGAAVAANTPATPVPPAVTPPTPPTTTP